MHTRHIYVYFSQFNEWIADRISFIPWIWIPQASLQGQQEGIPGCV
ncbi:MAG: hypothetical protein K0S14_3180 [Thermomicrobiales bacterium]|jgi:hypothetical protein|nr:hypothetical protein [Thermomicrobiales bacterium]MDF3016823.1 hypothetical protein [Thermomicrobiales bacterium]